MASKPVVITADEFYGTDQLGSEQLEKLLVNNVTDLATSLVSGWDPNGLIIIPALTLNNTNSDIDNANIVLQGRLFEPKKVMSAKRFFNTDDASIQLIIKPFDAGTFVFKGRLTSELLNCSEFSFSIIKDGRELTSDEDDALGFRGFCLRAYINPQPPAGWAKVDISLFPLETSELLGTNRLAADPRFPGISLAHPAGLVSMGPSSSSIFPGTDWGCPIAAALLAVSSTDDHPLTVTSTAIKQAVSSLLRTNIKPENKRDHTFLTTRWNEITVKGTAGLLPCTPDFTWPTAVSSLLDDSPGEGSEGASAFTPATPVPRAGTSRGRTAS